MNINLDISGSKDVIYVDEQDTSTSIVFYIKDNGSAVDLTGLTLSFVLHRTSYIVAPLTITSASSGIATLTLTSAMTASPGTLAFEVVGMESDDTPEFDISSYMVVQKVYSGSDGQNDPDEENPGIDVLYGEDEPDDETDGEDKDFYFTMEVETADVLEENDYTSTATASNPIEPQNWTTTSRNEFSFDIYAKPNNRGEGEYINFNLHGLVEGHTYAITFKFQFASGATFPWGEYNDYLDICGTRIDFATDTQEHTYTSTFTYEEGGVAQFGFPRIQDNAYFTAHITNLTVTGDFSGEIEDLYNKKDGYWKKYTPHEMIGASASADGQSGTVPKPTIADKDKFLKGDGTWAEAQGASAVSDLTDVELTNLADKEILEWDAVAEKWKNVANSGGGGGNALILDAQIYSLEEKQVGVWTDGKPLYQKTVWHTTNIINKAWNDVFIADNIEKLVDIEGHWYLNSDGTSVRLPIEYLNGNDRATYLYSKSDITSYNYVGVYPYFNGFDNRIDGVLLTVLYTKTTDTAGSGGYQAYGFSPIIYSEEEREVGVWIDNKPLYAKTISHDTAMTNRAWTQLINDSNIYIKLYDGCIYLDGYPYTYINYHRGVSQSEYSCGAIFNNGHGFQIYPSIDGATITCKVTLYYTKTTDTPGSGKYNTLGVPNVHYTENEQVIGTYLGKPLYQKTIVTNMASGATTCDIPFTGCNIKRMVDLIAIIDGTSSSGNAITCTINGIVSGNNGAITIKSLSSNGAYGFFDDAGVQIKRAYAAWFEPNMQIEVTIKYTKTTD